ncbi:MAG: peptidylprolyl isomerase [Bacteroidales bacterium]|nr:peptidylprolyl isomerase [Lentimicrobiaceae bacterium]MDD5694264.1 peptidylprolyl isomerase [Bacteroidales bacterium]
MITKSLSFILLTFTLLLVACQSTPDHPVVALETEAGTIRVELYPEAAPLTVANFLSYVDKKMYDGASFYRVVRYDNQENPVPIAVVQGGLDLVIDVDSLTPIPHESTDKTGILHRDGVISMARYGPGTATSEFFICVGDQPSLDFGGKRNPDGYGFAAFGRVIAGMDVVRKIHQGETTGDFQRLNTPVRIKRIYRDE